MGAAPEWMTSQEASMRTIGRKSCAWSYRARHQYQTMIDNVQVELAYTCDGDVWFAFTERWADISIRCLSVMYDLKNITG